MPLVLGDYGPVQPPAIPRPPAGGAQERTGAPLRNDQRSSARSPTMAIGRIFLEELVQKGSYVKYCLVTPGVDDSVWPALDTSRLLKMQVTLPRGLQPWMLGRPWLSFTIHDAYLHNKPKTLVRWHPWHRPIPGMISASMEVGPGTTASVTLPKRGVAKDVHNAEYPRRDHPHRQR